jgi:hypothetical protein
VDRVIQSKKSEKRVENDAVFQRESRIFSHRWTRMKHRSGTGSFYRRKQREQRKTRITRIDTNFIDGTEKPESADYADFRRIGFDLRASA